MGRFLLVLTSATIAITRNVPTPTIFTLVMHKQTFKMRFGVDAWHRVIETVRVNIPKADLAETGTPLGHVQSVCQEEKTTEVPS